MMRLGKDYKKAVDQMTIELEMYKAKSKMLQKQCEEYKDEISNGSKKLVEERDRRMSSDDNCKKISMQAKASENSLLRLIEKKDMKIFEYENQINSLKLEISSNKVQNSGIDFEIEHQNDVCIQISIKEPIIPKINIHNDPPDQKINSKDEVDSALKQNLLKYQLKSVFRKQQSNIYIYGSKKYYMIVKNGALLCRIGGGFQNFEDFIKGLGIYRPKSHVRHDSPLKPDHRRTRTSIGDPTKILDDRMDTDSSSLNSCDISPTKSFQKSFAVSKPNSARKSKDC